MTTTERAALDSQTILARARDAMPVLRAEAAESERRGQLTPAAVDALRATGVFRMSMPRSWGGPEVDPCTQVEIVETLARADGSAGWCAMIGSDSGFFTSHIDDAVGRALYPDLDAVTAGWVQPAGQLHPVDGGYRLAGRWQFGSGSTHADVIIGGAVVMHDDQPVIGADGMPETRIAMLPAGQYRIIDTWDTTGLAGSGSHDYSIDDAFVPTGQTFRWVDHRREGPLYAWPGLFVAKFAGVPLGIARGALDAAERILEGKLIMPEMRPARDDPRVRSSLARAEALVGSAGSYAFDVVGDLWDALVRGDEPSHRQRAAVGGCYAHTTRTCREAVELLADAVGSASIHRRSPIERDLRDLITLSQHLATQTKFLETIGGLWLGVDNDHPLLVQRLF